MRSFEDHAARIKDIFEHQGRSLAAADFIAAGVHPVMAWLYYKNFAPEAVLDHTDFADRVLQGWPKGIEPPSPEQLLDWAFNRHALDEMGATHLGQIGFDWIAIRDICRMLKITPDMLVPPNQSVCSDKFDTTPAPGEYVEAGTHMFLEMTYDERKVYQPLLNFLYAECQKADRLGYAHLYPGYPSNAEMLARAEMAYDTAAEEAPDSLKTTAEDMPLAVSDTYIIREELDHICHDYEVQMGIYIRNLAKDIEVISYGKDYYQRLLWDCSLAVARDDGNNWLAAFNQAKKDKGLEWAIERVMKNPDEFHDTHMFFWSTPATLSDGRILKGRDIIKAFCEAYRAFSLCHREGEDPKKLEALAMKHDEAVSRLVDFQTWRHAPQTKIYLRAMANARHIEAEMHDWVKGPKERQTPRAGRPILRIAYQGPKAKT